MAARINNGGQPIPYEDALEKERAAHYIRQGRPVPVRNNPVQTAARQLNAKPTAINRRPAHGWPDWCVPASMIVAFIREHEDTLAAEYVPTQFTSGDVSWSANSDPTKRGWLQLLAARVGRTLKIDQKAAIRRLYYIMNEATQVTGTEYADAIYLAVGQDLNHSSMPILPGSKAMAQNLIAIRAEVAEIELDDLELQRLARRTQRLSQLIVGYPRHVERLRDLAPLDCLRPYR